MMNHSINPLLRDTPPTSQRSLRRLSAIVLALSLTSCASMTGIHTHATLKDASAVGLPAQDNPNLSKADFEIDASWWHALGDAQLNQLIDTAIAQSPNLKIAQARLEKAQAQLSAANATLGPKVNGSIEATRERFSENGQFQGTALAGQVKELGTAQIAGSWELDFFGKNRNQVAAAIGMAHASEADAAAAKILLTTEITRQYINLAAQQAQLQINERMLQQRTETYELVKSRFDAGLDSQLEAQQSIGQIPVTKQQIAAIQENIAHTRNAIIALVGTPELANTLKNPDITALHTITTPANLPANLLGRRADIVAARWRVEASDKTINQAKAMFYPNVNLTAFAGFNSIGLNNLHLIGSRQWGITPAISLPIFESGSLKANLKDKSADYDIAVESYNQTLLQAVQQVSDTLVSQQSIGQQQNEQLQAKDAAEKSYGIAKQRYQAGLTDYLHVLTTETNVLTQRSQTITLLARALDNNVQLANALGGGYSNQDFKDTH